MLTRRTALVAGTATLAAAAPLRFARAAEFTFKWGTNVPESHQLNVHAKAAIAKLKEETGGRVDLQLFANNVLGGDSDMFTQLRAGALECFSLSGVNVLSTLIPSIRPGPPRCSGEPSRARFAGPCLRPAPHPCATCLPGPAPMPACARPQQRPDSGSPHGAALPRPTPCG